MTDRDSLGCPVTVAVDVDGVVAPVAAEPDKDCVELPRVMHGTHVLTRAVATLKHWHFLGAEVRWHTAWRPPYTDDLEDVLSLPGFGPFAPEEEFLRPTPETQWWKLAAVRRWLRDSRNDDALLIWIDDEAEDFLRVDCVVDPRLLVVVPDSATGLRPAEIDRIAQAIRSRR